MIKGCHDLEINEIEYNAVIWLAGEIFQELEKWIIGADYCID